MADSDKAWHAGRMLVTVSMSGKAVLTMLSLKLIGLEITSKHRLFHYFQLISLDFEGVLPFQTNY